jgi:two-component system, chemotaxis family, protein-glutamate methylesterase/glutaminase
MEVDGMAVRVLIADGSGLTRDVVRRHLECGGCQVIAEAETAAQAVNLFRTVRPDVVAMDVGLPRAGDLDALSVLRTIRREAPAVNVIMLSAESAPEASRRVFLSEGALDCIAEPIEGMGFEKMWRRLAEAYPELPHATPSVPGVRHLRRS